MNDQRFPETFHIEELDPAGCGLECDKGISPVELVAAIVRRMEFALVQIVEAYQQSAIIFFDQLRGGRRSRPDRQITLKEIQEMFGRRRPQPVTQELADYVAAVVSSTSAH